MTRLADELYVGYLKTPPAIRRVVVLAYIAMVVFALGAATGSVLSMTRMGPGVYDVGTPVTIRGVVQLGPVPLLRARREDGSPRDVLLVGFGKRSAGPVIAGFEGAHVAAQGWLIARSGVEMLELASDAAAGGAILTRLNDPAPTIAAPRVERMTIRGEVIDAKCFLGVMKPGRGKTHLACAINCVRGGVPAGIAIPRAHGDDAFIALAATEGVDLREALIPFIGRAVEAEVELERLASGLAIARINPARDLRIAR